MITLQLIDVPFDADIANPQGRPLGSRDQVAKRVGELLPGTQFDENGRGLFRRGAYQIVFMMYGEPPTSVGIAFDQAEAFTPIARIVDKTGWCLIDPEQKAFVDLPASRAAGRTVLLGDNVESLKAAAAALPSAPLSTAGVLKAGGTKVGRLLVAALLGLVIAGGAYGAAWYFTNGRVSMKLPASILATQASATRFDKYPDRLVRRREMMAALPAPYATDKIVEQMMDAQMAMKAYHSFVDGRFTSPEVLSSESIWTRFSMPSFLPASFGQHQRDGYEFEFKGEGCEEAEPGWPECRNFTYVARPLKAAEGAGVVYAVFGGDDKIHVRTDGRVPGKDDPAIEPHKATNTEPTQ